MCLILSLYFLSDNLFTNQVLNITCGTTFLSSLPLIFRIDLSYENLILADEVYPSPTNSDNEDDGDDNEGDDDDINIVSDNDRYSDSESGEEISPEIIQAVRDDMRAFISGNLERDREILQEELGDNVDLRVLVVYDDEDDSSDGPDSDANVLCDTSLVYGFQGDLGAEELAYYLAFFL